MTEEKTNMNKHKLTMMWYYYSVSEKGKITFRREFTKEEAFDASWKKSKIPNPLWHGKMINFKWVADRDGEEGNEISFWR